MMDFCSPSPFAIPLSKLGDQHFWSAHCVTFFLGGAPGSSWWQPGFALRSLAGSCLICCMPLVTHWHGLWWHPSLQSSFVILSLPFSERADRSPKYVGNCSCSLLGWNISIHIYERRVSSSHRRSRSINWEGHWKQSVALARCSLALLGTGSAQLFSLNH